MTDELDRALKTIARLGATAKLNASDFSPPNVNYWGDRCCKAEAENERLRGLLSRCREKLKAYYEDTRGEYPGGPLYGDLMRAISEVLDVNQQQPSTEKL